MTQEVGKGQRSERPLGADNVMKSRGERCAPLVDPGRVALFGGPATCARVSDGVGVEMAAGVVAEIQVDDSGVLIGGDVEVELRRRQWRPSR